MSIKRGGNGILREDLVIKPCACGCGGMAGPRKDFINGHNNHGDRNPMKNPEIVKKSLETKKKNPLSYNWQRGENSPMRRPEIAAKVSKTKREYFASEVSNKTRLKMSKAQSGENNYWFGKKGKDNPTYGLKRSEETKKKLSVVTSNFFNSKRGEDQKEKLSEMAKNQWKNPEYAKKHSEAMYNYWQTPEFVAKQMKSRGVRPNKLEKKFEKFLNNLYPNEWKYVGDGQLIISGKCPDFVNVNGKKQLIEIYGDYWHKGQNPEDRKKIFRKFGYDTLVLWEKELKKIDNVKAKLDEFVKSKLLRKGM